MSAIEDLLAKVKPATASVKVCLRGDLMGDLNTCRSDLSSNLSSMHLFFLMRCDLTYVISSDLFDARHYILVRKLVLKNNNIDENILVSFV